MDAQQEVDVETEGDNDNTGRPHPENAPTTVTVMELPGSLSNDWGLLSTCICDLQYHISDSETEYFHDRKASKNDTSIILITMMPAGILLYEWFLNGIYALML